MKLRRLLSCILASAYALCASAQTYLVDKFTPVEKSKYPAVFRTYTSADREFEISSQSIGRGFTLQTQSAVVNEPPTQAYAVFDVGGKFEKISFVIGPSYYNRSRNEDAIATIKADGNIIFDEVIFGWHAPREVVLDISGVKQLRFAIPAGTMECGFGNVRLWKAGESFKPTRFAGVPDRSISIPDDLKPYLAQGPICTIGKAKVENVKNVDVATSNRHKFTSGMMYATNQQLIGKFCGYTYFWLQEKYDKLAFVLGVQDSKSTQASGWISIMADGKTIYEKLLKQGDLAEQVVIDIAGVNVLSIHSELRDCAFLGGMNILLGDIKAYRKGDTGMPAPGLMDYSAQELSKLPDVCKMCSSMKPYSYGGVADIRTAYFSGESSHYTFSMGGEKFTEGFVLATGNTLFGDNISAYLRFDMGGQYDYISFKAGALSKNHVIDDDLIRIYADDELVLETRIYSMLPNQYFEVPIKKCRILTFAKPGTGKDKQIYTGIGDLIMYRGEPVQNQLFVHAKPECPEQADLIDLCGKPYFHFVGRYLSDLTNFDFEDCFMDGSTIKRSFKMADGSEVYKGIMLESNKPLGLENVNLTDVLYMVMLGAGGAISSSNLSALTGVTAGAGMAGGMAAMRLVSDDGGQASAAAFNIYGEYESLTFTIAVKSVFRDTDIFGASPSERQEKFHVFADQRPVGEFMLSDTMKPMTVTVPLNKANHIMFWMDYSGARSSQYVIYDMKLDKKKLPYTQTNLHNEDVSKPGSYKVESALESAQREKQEAAKATKEARRNRSRSKEKQPVVWERPRYCSDESVRTFLNDVSTIWEDNEKLKKNYQLEFKISETWVQALDGSVFKCVSYLDANGRRLNTNDLQRELLEAIEVAKNIRINAGIAKIGIPAASMAAATLPVLEDIVYYTKTIKLGNDALNQCVKEAETVQKAKEIQLEMLQNYIKTAVNVGVFKSTAMVMILVPSEGEQAPAWMQSLESYDFH